MFREQSWTTVKLVRGRGGPQITPLADPKEAEAAAASFFFWLREFVTDLAAKTISS
jgi:hypothetical protein